MARMITFKVHGDFKNTEGLLRKISRRDMYNSLEKYAKDGVNALENATPHDSGLTSSAWDYEIINSGQTTSIYWTNSSMAGSAPVVILLQYGHATGTGGYVQGIDFINPALKPVFDRISNDVWKVVTSA